VDIKTAWLFLLFFDIIENNIAVEKNILFFYEKD